MKKTFKRSVSFILAFVMVLGTLATLPLAVFAANDYTINSTTSTDDYYNLISKKDWDIAPGITESEIVLNNDDGSRRQVLFVMEADLNNEYVKVINSYNGMVPEYGNYKTGVMSEQAAYAEANGYGNVVGAMNTTLSWYTNYPADRIGEPLGFIMLDAEILFDPANCGYTYGNVGFPSVLVINKDIDDEGNPRPADVPKVEMPQIRSANDLDGWEDQVIPCSSGYIVKDGVNQYRSNHTDAAPRSVVGIKPDGTVVIMLNDGRQDPYSAGMSMYELAEVMLDLGCSFAVNCDGGGTSTYLSQRPGEELKVNNSPSDGAERPTTSGILFISTAPSTEEFIRAEITTDYNYYTPNSAVQFNSIATNLVGKQVDMPADITWQLSDISFGTITNDGLFTSNGKTGKVTAQIVHDGKVKGEKAIQVVWPTDFAFASNTMTIPYGKTIDIELIATYEGTESYVALKNGDVSFELDDSTLGVISGYSFTANADENSEVTEGTLTATINGLTATTNIVLGKGSQCIFGFDTEEDKDDWILKDYNVYTTSTQKDVVIENAIEIVTPETGKVHSGNSAMAVTVDYSNGLSGGWTQFRLIYTGDYFEIANAKRIGFWIWMPDEAYANEIDVCLAYIDANGNLAKGAPVLTDIGYCISGQDEPGWRYFTLDISAHPILYMGEHEDQTNFNRCFYLQFYNYTNQWKDEDSIVNTMSKFTYFIDDITIEYSDATDDSDAPVFGEVNLLDSNGVASVMNGQTIDYNTFSAEVSVVDFIANNTTGINPNSAKAYVDGVEVDCSYSNGRISISDIKVADGLHTVKFVICDNMGNLNSVIRQIVVDADSDIPTINLIPHDDSLTNLPLGSIYYVDLVASDIEKVQKFVVDLDLINTFDWELAYADVAYGFELSYEIDRFTNVATITVVRVGNGNLNGSQLIASIPVRVWDITFDRGDRAGNELTEVYLSVKCLRGVLTCIDGTVSSFTCDSVKIATELWMSQWNTPSGFTSVYTHTHIANPIEDKVATETENGYSGRMYCYECESVVDWGTIIPALGHSFKVVENKLECECGEQYTGTGLVEFGDVWYYTIAGNLQSGWQMIDDNWYYFDSENFAGTNGTYHANKFMFTTREVYYTFVNGKLTRGTWVAVENGNVRYYYGPDYYRKSWRNINGTDYYFDNEGSRVTGIYCIKANAAFGGSAADVWYEFDANGALIGKVTGIISGKEKLYYVENGVLCYKGLFEFGEDIYYADENGCIVTGIYNVEKNNGILSKGTYIFGSDGKLTDRTPLKSGVVKDEDGEIRYYVNGEATYAGLVQDSEGNIYYINSSLKAVKNCSYTVYSHKANGLMEAGTYHFDAEGKLYVPEEVKNGVVKDEDGEIRYYVDGEATYAGLVQDSEGNIYYINSSLKAVKNCSYTVYSHKTNGLMEAGTYHFDAEGKLYVPEEVKNGVVKDEDGEIRYYVDGEATYAGLVQDSEGNIYYINSSLKAVKNCSYTVYSHKTNGLMEAGTYHFDAEGKLYVPEEVKNGVVKDEDGEIRYYVDGEATYAGLVQDSEGNIYYINSSLKAVKNCSYTVYSHKTNGLMEAGTYIFGEDGKLIH